VYIKQQLSILKYPQFQRGYIFKQTTERFHRQSKLVNYPSLSCCSRNLLLIADLKGIISEMNYMKE
jgi:hypothetical protein